MTRFHRATAHKARKESLLLAGILPNAFGSRDWAMGPCPRLMRQHNLPKRRHFEDGSDGTCAAQADLAPAFRHGDDHEVGMPIAPTISAIAPRPRKKVVEEPATATRAASASEGRLTETSSGASGLAVGASRSATPTT
jgi:hypothetical protein